MQKLITHAGFDDLEQDFEFQLLMFGWHLMGAMDGIANLAELRQSDAAYDALSAGWWDRTERDLRFQRIAKDDGWMQVPAWWALPAATRWVQLHERGYL